MYTPSHINFHGAEWAAIKKILKDMQEKKINLLISAETHDKSNELRGSLKVITELLRLEDAAYKAATRGN